MKFRFRNLSIRHKLTLITTLTSMIATVLVCAAFMVYELTVFREGIVRELSILAEIIGTSSTAALTFDDRFAAEEIVTALGAKPHVISACIYRSNGSMLASYIRSGPIQRFPSPVPGNGHRFYNDRLELFQPIVLHGENIGTLFLRYDIAEIRALLKKVAAIAGCVFPVSALVAFVLGIRLQRLISKPIVHLSRIVRQVSAQKDYSVRAAKESEDESGLLIDGFNEMLAQIQSRDIALQKNQEELEMSIQKRTEALRQEIFEHRRSEEEKEQIQAQLLQAQKMEAVGILAGGVAHDFNNLLTAIQGWTELVMEGMDEHASAYQDMLEIRAATKRAADLTQQLLLFSRKKTMRMVSIDFNSLLKGILKICQRLIGENIDIRTNLHEDLWTVKADRGTVEQMIMNLVVNAKDAMPRGGNITLRTSNVYIDELYCKGDPEARPGPFVRLTVSDNGLGMSRETLRHIFEPFFTTKGIGKGTGLGLSVIYGIVKQHEGWITVYSEFGHGSTFRVYLPAIKKECGVETEACPSLETMHGTGERILVVEDEINVAEFNKKALTQYGYSVFLSRSLQEARQTFRNEKGNFRLVFSDVVLPDGSGIDLLDEFRCVNPGVRVMLSSGYTDHKLQWPAIGKKGYRFLQKPYSLAELLKAIRDETAACQNA